MSFDDFLHCWKAETAAGVFAERIEDVEHLFFLLNAHAAAGVDDFQNHGFALANGRHFKHAAVGHRFDGVSREISENLP